MPGRCPSCNQSYVDEALTFCPNDGTPLIREAPPAAYDPQAGMYGSQPPAPGGYPPPPPQQGYYPGAPQQPGGQAPPPPPPPGWQQPYGQQQQQQYAPQYGAPAGGSKNKMPLIIGALALVLIGGGVGLYFLLRDNSSSTANTNSRVTPTSSPSATRSPGSTTTTTFPTPSTTTTTTAGNYTEDQRHRLFQAVGMTGDSALIVEVAQKIGLFDSRGQPNDQFAGFVKEHAEWGKRNFAWAQEYRDPVKARAYVMANK